MIYSETSAALVAAGGKLGPPPDGDLGHWWAADAADAGQQAVMGCRDRMYPGHPATSTELAAAAAAGRVVGIHGVRRNLKASRPGWPESPPATALARRMVAHVARNAVLDALRSASATRRRTQR